MKFFATAAAATIALSAPAFAADLIIEEPSYIAPVSVYDWSGFYLGAHAGWAFGSGDQDITVDSLGFLDPEFAAIDISGGFVGATAGFNHQMDSIVFGVEGDVAWAGISGYTNTNNDPDDDGFETTVDWLATLRGRVGYAVDSFLLYGTGGLAVAGIGVENGDVDGDVFDPITGTASTSLTGVGFVAGAGVEVAVTENISVKAEYNYYDFGTIDFAAPDSLGGTEEGTVTTNFHAVKFGINYAF